MCRLWFKRSKMGVSLCLLDYLSSLFFMFKSLLFQNFGGYVFENFHKYFFEWREGFVKIESQTGDRVSNLGPWCQKYKISTRFNVLCSALVWVHFLEMILPQKLHQKLLPYFHSLSPRYIFLLFIPLTMIITSVKLIISFIIYSLIMLL